MLELECQSFDPKPGYLSITPQFLISDLLMVIFMSDFDGKMIMTMYKDSCMMNEQE